MQGTQAGSRRGLARITLRAAALCLLACAAISLNAPAAGAASSGTLTISPEASSLAVGDSAAVTLNLSGAVDVHEVDLYLLYNPGVVKVVDADAGTPGTQILPGPFPGSGGSVVANSAAGGSIQYQFVLPASVTATGSGTVATVRFEALADGDAGLAWGTVQLIGGDFTATTPSTSATSFSVGGSTTLAATGTPGPTDTPAPTDTPGATDTPAATNTPVPTSAAGTPTDTPTANASTTTTRTPTRTPTTTGTPLATVTPRSTSTPRVTVLQNSNQPTQTIDQKLGVAPATTDPKSTLPSAGNAGPGTQWWRWTFFGAALMLGIAGWFFTFAIHHSDRDVVLLDRHDRRRRRP